MSKINLSAGLVATTPLSNSALPKATRSFFAFVEAVGLQRNCLAQLGKYVGDIIKSLIAVWEMLPNDINVVVSSSYMGLFFNFTVVCTKYVA